MKPLLRYLNPVSQILALTPAKNQLPYCSRKQQSARNLQPTKSLGNCLRLLHTRSAADGLLRISLQCIRFKKKSPPLDIIQPSEIMRVDREPSQENAITYPIQVTVKCNYFWKNPLMPVLLLREKIYRPGVGKRMAKGSPALPITSKTEVLQQPSPMM